MIQRIDFTTFLQESPSIEGMDGFSRATWHFSIAVGHLSLGKQNSNGLPLGGSI